MGVGKPKFNPSAPYEAVKPKFDPSKPVEEARDYETEALKGAEAKYEQNKPGYIETAGLGTLQGLTRGWGDEAVGALSSLGSGAGPSSGGYENARDRIRERMRAAQAENPKTYAGGEFVGAAPIAAAASTPLGWAGISAGEGLARGLGDAEELDKKGITNAAKSAAIAAPMGYAGAKILPAIGSKIGEYTEPVIGKVKDWVRERAGQQAVKALQPTQGQYKNLATSGKLSDVGNLMLDEKVVTPFASSKTMSGRVEDLSENLGNQVKPIYEASKGSNMSKDDLIGVIDGKIAELKMEPSNAPIIRKLEGYKDDIANAGRESYNPADMRNLRQGAAGNVNWMSDAPSQLGSKQMTKIARDQEMGLIEKVDPELRSQNEDLFRKIHLSKLAEPIAERGEARRGVNNLLGLNTWQAGKLGALSSVASSTLTPAGAGLVAGTTMAARELTKRYGNQMTATGLRKVEGLLQAPKYSRIFEEAAKKGPQALSVAHSLLMQKDPEYKAAFEGALTSKEGNENP